MCVCVCVCVCVCTVRSLLFFFARLCFVLLQPSGLLACLPACLPVCPSVWLVWFCCRAETASTTEYYCLTREEKSLLRRCLAAIRRLWNCCSDSVPTLTCSLLFSSLLFSLLSPSASASALLFFCVCFRSLFFSPSLDWSVFCVLRCSVLCVVFHLASAIAAVADTADDAADAAAAASTAATAAATARARCFSSSSSSASVSVF